MDLTNFTKEQLNLYSRLLVSLAPNVYEKYHEIAEDNFSLQINKEGISRGEFDLPYDDIADEVIDIAYKITVKSGL